MKLNLKLDPEIFNKIYLDKLLKNQNRIQITFGGASSGKSKYRAQQTVLDILQGRNYLVTRKVQRTIRQSAFNEVLKVISEFKLVDYFEVNRSDMLITCRINDSQGIFIGMDDPEKVKSITPKKGVITDIWAEETTEFDREDIKQLEKRLRGQSKFIKRVHLTFNPILKSHWIYKEYFEGFWEEGLQYKERPGLSILKTTYKDNKFLTEEDIHALENEKDRYYFEVYTLGNWGILGHVIFTNWRIEKFKTEGFDNFRNGIDWGFANDPFAFVRLHYDRARRKLYVCEEICETGLLNVDSAKRVKEIIKDEPVICDSAEPKSIQEYTQLGVCAYPAKKGRGSIEYGIKFLQSLEIIIHPNCQCFINQIQIAQWKEDKYGHALPIPIDKDNDLLDATRYGLENDSYYTEETPEQTINDVKKLPFLSQERIEAEDRMRLVYNHHELILSLDSQEEAEDSVTGY